jgi:hypothetical protein
MSVDESGRATTHPNIEYFLRAASPTFDATEGFNKILEFAKQPIFSQLNPMHIRLETSKRMNIIYRIDESKEKKKDEFRNH